MWLKYWCSVDVVVLCWCCIDIWHQGNINVAITCWQSVDVVGLLLMSYWFLCWQKAYVLLMLMQHWHLFDETLMKDWFLWKSIYFSFIFCWGPPLAWSTEYSTSAPFQITVVHPVLPDDDNDSKEANEDSGPASFGQVCCSCFTTKLTILAN